MISSPAASNDATKASTYLKDWLKEDHLEVHKIWLKMKKPDTLRFYVKSIFGILEVQNLQF